MSGLDLFGDVSTADTGTRDPFDFYETPTWMTRSLLHFYPPLRGAYVWEPCSGRDAIAKVLREEGRCEVFTNDLNPAQTRAMRHGDATREGFWALSLGRTEGDGTLRRPQYVCTNVAFNVAYPILQLAVKYATRGVIMLLRKTFDEPTLERGEWLNRNPWHHKVGEPRHSFRGVGSDNTSCDWFIYEHEDHRHPEIPACMIDHLAETRTRPIIYTA